MMRIYFSHQSADLASARRCVAQIKAAGHEIVYDWLGDIEEQDDMDTLELERRAGECLDALEGADLVLFVCPMSAGCLVEFGAALSAELPCLVVGHFDHFFGHHHLVERFRDLQAALRSLGSPMDTPSELDPELGELPLSDLPELTD